MSTATFIEPSLADAPAIRPVFRNGRLVYIVHGICQVGSLDEAMDLITDRRQAPRSVAVPIAQPTHTIEYGIGGDASIRYFKHTTFV